MPRTFSSAYIEAYGMGEQNAEFIGNADRSTRSARWPSVRLFGYGGGGRGRRRAHMKPGAVGERHRERTTVTGDRNHLWLTGDVGAQVTFAKRDAPCSGSVALAGEWAKRPLRRSASSHRN